MRLSRVSHFALLTLALFSGTVSAGDCAQPGKDGPVYVGNSYYPGTGNASASGYTLNLGTQRLDGGANSTALAAGDEIFIIQMQDADINPTGGPLNGTSTTSNAYGDGSTGRGYTNLNNTGHYEFAVIKSISGSVVTLRDPLQYAYTASGATASSVRRSFQVLRVPQHSALTLNSGITAAPWNGQTGGVVVLDVAGTLNLNGQAIDASAAGFRGGGSFLGGSFSGQKVTDYANTYVTTNSRGAMKGEGYSGTPTLVRGTTVASGYTGTSAGLDSSDLGYPNAYVVARGAPGNAGGGATQHNSGGGGGGNVGDGGKGGYSFGFYYDTNQTGTTCLTLTSTSGATTFYSCNGDGSRDVGGLGGVGLTPDATRLIAGGGGGAGDSNNGSDNNSVAQGSGGTGGGIIFIRAGGLTGSGSLLANGQAGQPAGRDGAGGGGAGGTVALDIPAGAYGGVSVQVRGGAGGNSGLPLKGNESQGPAAGGGGGGVLLGSGVSIGSADVTGGAAGVNTPKDGISNTYGAMAGNGGSGQLSYANSHAPLPGLCLPQLTVTKSTSTPTRFVGTGAATYTITVSNASGRGDAQNVTVSDPALPSKLIYASTANTQLNGTATQSSATAPAAGATAPSWSNFTLPGGSSVSVTFNANLNDSVAGTYQNAAQATYLDPLRTTTAGTATASYDPASSTGEDVTIYDKPKIVLEKWVRNVSRNESFDTSDSGLPSETLEYCINFRNDGGYVANGFTLADTIPANVNVLTDAYGTGLGVRLATGSQLVKGSAQPAGTNLTSAADPDAASLSAANGLKFTTDLAAGGKGTVCFQGTLK